MKLLQNLARVFVDELQARLEYEIKEVMQPPPKPRKTRAPRLPKAPPKQLSRVVQVSPGVEYIPPSKPQEKPRK